MSAAAVELPLFPLGVVLFPGTVLPLHVFEARYRQMIMDCQREEKPFGVVLARPESEHLYEEPYTIGTMAEIRNLDQLEDGRYILMVVGTKRFRIVSQHREKPYLSGLVELYEDTVEPESELLLPMRQARELFEHYVQMLLEEAEENDIRTNLPTSAEGLSHFIANFLDIQDERKQELLELTSTRLRLQEEISVLRREVPFMRQILSSKVPLDRALLN